MLGRSDDRSLATIKLHLKIQPITVDFAGPWEAHQARIAALRGPVLDRVEALPVMSVEWDVYCSVDWTRRRLGDENIVVVVVGME